MTAIRALIAVVLMFASTGVAVRAGDSGWTLRMYGALVDSSVSNQTSATGFATRVDVGGGLGVGGEYRLSSRLGVELSTLFANLDMEAAVSLRGFSSTQSLQFGMVPLTLGVTFHLNPEGRTDIFVAPTLSYVSYSEFETRYRWNGLRATIGGSSDTAIGAALGVDVPFGEGKWRICTGLRFMKTAAEDVNVDPLIVTLGFGRRL